MSSVVEDARNLGHHFNTPVAADDSRTEDAGEGEAALELTVGTITTQVRVEEMVTGTSGSFSDDTTRTRQLRRDLTREETGHLITNDTSID
jgi:hypothetical protein